MKQPTLIVTTAVICCGVFAAVLWGLDSKRRANPSGNSEIFTSNRPPLIKASTELSGANSVDFRAAAKKILPSVVSIDTQVEGETIFGEKVVEDAGSGSGVVISEKGYVVTNNHVIRRNLGFGRSRLVDSVFVTFSDGKKAKAKVLGSDPRADLAVLKVDRSDITPIAIGDSSKLEVGQWVVAVGNPLGYENTLSVGVVSNVGRPLPGSGNAVFIDGIQTDAAINPGNSGGALCNSEGELIGINSSIATTTRANIGIGFAIPVNRMRQVVEDIVQFGYAKYGQLGVQMWQQPHGLQLAEARNELKARTQTSSEPPSNGAVVLAVETGSAAASAGIKMLDVVTEINGTAIDDIETFQKVMSPLRPGTKVSFKVWSNGQFKTVNAELGDAGKASL